MLQFTLSSQTMARQHAAPAARCALSTKALPRIQRAAEDMAENQGIRAPAGLG